jgi:MFS family permease
MKIIHPVPPEARRQFVVDLFSAIATGIYFGMALPFAGITARRLGASPGWVAAIEAAAPLGCLVSLYWSTKVRSFGAVRSVVVLSGGGRGLLILMPLVACVVPDGRALAGTMFVSLFVSSLCIPAYVGVMGQVYPNRCRATIMGYVRIGLAGAWVIGSIVGGALLEKVDPFTYYAAAGTIGLSAGLIFSRIAKDRPPPMDPAATRFSLRQFVPILRANIPYRNFLLFSFLLGLGNLIVMSVAPVFWKDWLDLASPDISVLAAVMQTVSVITYFSMGAVIDHARPMWMVSRLQLLYITVPVIYVIAGATGAGSVLFLSFALRGFLLPGFNLSITRAVITIAKEDDISRYQGLWSFAFGVRGVVAPVIGVWLLNLGGGPGVMTGYLIVFGTGFILASLGAGLSASLARRARRMENRILDREQREGEST